MHYVTSPEAMAIWATATGELPARPSPEADAAVERDPVLAPFGRGLEGAYATDFVDEDAQRAVFVEMLDRVLLKGQPARDSVREAAAAEQAIIDRFYKT
jgi:multiple sugar transport system substrate-binding protein